MPPYVTFRLIGIAPNPLDYADRPATFTTESGYPVWINRREN